MAEEETLLLKLERSFNLSWSEVSKDKLVALFKDLYNYGYFESNITISNETLDYDNDYVADDNASATTSLDWEILSMCGNHQKEEFWKIWQEFVFWCEGVILLLVGSMGCIGNIVAISILSSERANLSPFHCLLIGLSICDLLFLTFSMPIHAILNPKMAMLNSLSNMMPFCIAYRFMLYPFCGVAYNIGVFITMAITIERFHAVCFPHRYRDANISTTPLKRALIYIIPAAIIALVLNIPKFLEVQITEKNGTVTCVASELTVDETFVNWIKLTYIINPFFSTTLIPILVLFVLNACIYRKIIQTRQKNRGRSANPNKSGQAQQTDTKIQAILIIICVVFVLTHFPRLILSILAFSQRSKATECASHNLYYVPELSVVCMETVSNLLIHVNASLNFLIYSCNFSNFIGNCRNRIFHLFRSPGGDKDKNNIVQNGIEASQDKSTDDRLNVNSSSANTTGLSESRQVTVLPQSPTKTSQTHSAIVHNENSTSGDKQYGTHLHVNVNYRKNSKVNTNLLKYKDKMASSLSLCDPNQTLLEPRPDSNSTISAPTSPRIVIEEYHTDEIENQSLLVLAVLEKTKRGKNEILHRA